MGIDEFLMSESVICGKILIVFWRLKFYLRENSIIIEGLV